MKNIFQNYRELTQKSKVGGSTRISKMDGPARMPKAGGFTLIEALVAISILVISVTGPLSLAAKGLSYSNYAKDEITAFYLANEAIDVIRNIRDTNIKSSGSDSWINIPGGKIIGKCGGSGCYFDVWKNPLELISANNNENITLKTCSEDNLVRFGYFEGPGSASCASPEQSSFSRKVIVELVATDGDGNPTEIRVTATVSWTTRTGIVRSVPITENLFKLGSI